MLDVKKMDKGLIIHCVLVNKKNQVLILKRNSNDDVLPGYWDIPGGTLKDGEDPSVGVVREVKEESGVDVCNPNLFFYTSNIDDKKNKQFVRLIFITQCDNEDITLCPEEHEDFKWIDLSEIGNYNVVDYINDCFGILKDKKHILFNLV